MEIENSREHFLKFLLTSALEINKTMFFSSVLIEAGGDVNLQDLDGWTPLHAAAHWDQEKACEILVENFCAMEVKNDAVSLLRSFCLC